ncbi:competence/damage-inducible protein A [Synechococcus sp. PCC 7336]|uniref:competence/damage-inducible protein A n=1 Tax=Synechococcus sp. PCC 7336 TaxID=195250 RepID=UPI00034D435B|nr:competence/damage-inducible protein A [Synechococcus sp. PCC 7336]
MVNPNDRASAEIICIGTELLLGEILNSNARYLARHLAELGIPHHFQTVVGDNVDRIHQTLQLAQTRSSIVITTGGLGPTPDDLTHSAIASYFNTPLADRPEITARIEAYFTQRGLVMPPNNRRQAQLPQGAQILSNPVGSAPGIIWEAAPNFTLLTFPGVSREMQAMWSETAVPYLKSKGWGQQIFHSKVLRHWGISESGLAEKLGSLFELNNPTVAPYAGNGEVRIRITGKAANEAAAVAMVEPVAEKVRAIAGRDSYGSDDDTLASVTGQLLERAGQTVAVAESCTGGWIGQQLTTVPGSSHYFVGGVESYDNRVKQQLLQVSEADLLACGAVSERVARQMALGGRELLQADWGVSVTGIAGPGGGSAEKPVGLVFIGLADPEGKVTVSEHQFAAKRGRDWVRWLTTQTAIDRLRRALLDRLG